MFGDKNVFFAEKFCSSLLFPIKLLCNMCKFSFIRNITMAIIIEMLKLYEIKFPSLFSNLSVFTATVQSAGS